MKTCGLIKRVVIAAAMFIAPGLPAHQGMVETRDGKTYTGQVQLDTNQLIVVNAVQGFRVAIPLSDFLGASFRIEPRLASRLPFGEEAREVPPVGTLPDPWHNASIFPENQTQAEVTTGETFQLCTANLRFTTVLPLLVESVTSSAEVTPEPAPAWLARPQARFLYGVFQVDTAGTNITGASDSCHFVFKPVKGDSEIMARILHIPNTSPWAKAGIMMRENLRSDSANVFLALKPIGGGIFQWRETTGGETTVNEPRALGVPFWLKLKRTGNTFTAYCSRGGRQWRILQSVELPMAEEMYVGLATAGLREGQLTMSAQSKPGRGATTPQYKHCSFDQVREAPFLPSWFVPRIELQNGSTIVGRIASADDERIVFDGGLLAPDPLPMAAVASILFQWVPTKTQALFEAGRSGVILAGGEFVEGQFRAIQTGRLKMSSVLQGLRNYDLSDELMALVLRKTLPNPQAYEVQTVDGSIWLGEQLEMRNNELTVQAGAAGRRNFPLLDVRSIRRLNY